VLNCFTRDLCCIRRDDIYLRVLKHLENNLKNENVDANSLLVNDFVKSIV